MREIKFRGFNGEKWLFGNLEIDYKAKHACISDNRFWRHPVRFDTVGQFTGLRDSDGREIYEGDIIKVRTHNPYWRFRRNFLVTWGEDGWLLDGDSLYSWFSFHTLEVIGNIHDNPDLLEKQP